MQFRWKRIALVVLPVGAIVLFPSWYHRVNPDLYNDVRCMRPGTNGEIIKASDDDCWENTPVPEQAGDR